MDNVEELFQRLHLKTWLSQNGERYLDPIRNTFIKITPEETVRQKTIIYLQRGRHIPYENIRVEEHLSHYGSAKKGRCDIVITYRLNGEDEQALAVIECKKSDIPIHAMQVIEQATRYASEVDARYIILINGISACFYHRVKTGQYCEIEKILSYKQMMEDKFENIQRDKDFVRLSYEDYFNLDYLHTMDDFYDVVGEDTPTSFIPFIMNFLDCLLDTTHQLPMLPSRNLNLKKDLGVQYRTYNDASNGNFGAGYYRTFLVERKPEHTHFLCGASLMATGKTYNDPKYGNSTGKSVLSIFINTGNIDETVVQINLNSCLTILDKLATLVHDGRITRKGGKKQELLKYIADNNPSLVKKNSIYLGRMDFSDYMFLTNEDVMETVSNILEYAVYRNKYKMSLKK